MIKLTIVFILFIPSYRRSTASSQTFQIFSVDVRYQIDKVVTHNISRKGWLFFFFLNELKRLSPKFFYFNFFFLGGGGREDHGICDDFVLLSLLFKTKGRGVTHTL